MWYEYSDKAGYYGTGGWAVYSRDCYGYKNTVKVFDSECEAKRYLKA